VGLERLLLAFKRALEVPEALRSWDARTNACSGTWRGIACNQDRNSVTELYAIILSIFWKNSIQCNLKSKMLQDVAPTFSDFWVSFDHMSVFPWTVWESHMSTLMQASNVDMWSLSVLNPDRHSFLDLRTLVNSCRVVPSNPSWISKLAMKNQEKIDWKSELLLFTYGFQRCVVCWFLNCCLSLSN
jgi:hypothetical protein